MNTFGKFCRKLRIDRGELLKDMATKIGVSPAYLSAAEVGRRNVPKEWVTIIGKVYALDLKQKRELKEAFEESKTEIKIKLSGLSDEDRNLAAVFARKFESLDSETKDEILSVLRRKNNQKE